MESTKFVGMDVHKDAITIAVMNSAGKVVMESIIETKAVTILQFIQGLRGDVFIWLSKIPEAGVRRRAEHFYEQLDALQGLRKQVRRDLLAESRKHNATKLLRQIPSIGPIRAAELVALIQTPHRFRTKRQLWNYSGLGLETR